MEWTLPSTARRGKGPKSHPAIAGPVCARNGWPDPTQGCDDAMVSVEPTPGARVSPVWLVLIGILSVQFGAAVSKD
jgi:hypothetical protein